jgi:hypothetical protein
MNMKPGGPDVSESPTGRLGVPTEAALQNMNAKDRTGADVQDRRRINVSIPGHFNHTQTEQLIASHIPAGWEIDTCAITSLMANEVIVDGFNRPVVPPTPVDYTFSLVIVLRK